VNHTAIKTMNFFSYHSGSSGNLYQLKSSSGSLLIEAGVTINRIKKALEFKLSDISAALISHHHKDHCKAVSDIARAGIPCYMIAETAKALKFDGHRLNIIEPLKQFEVSGFKVLPFPIQHDVPGVGFLISNGADKLVYATDTFYVRYKFKGLTIIAVECNWSKETLAPGLIPIRKQRLYKSHMSLNRVKKFLKANDLSKVREIHLLHLSRENANGDYFKSEVMKATGKPVYVANHD